MRLPILRIILLAIAVEVLAIVILVGLIAIFGPNNQRDAITYAAHLGQFVGPIASTILCFLASWWLTRRVPQRELLCGFLLGLACVSIDLAALYPLGGSFNWVIVASNVCRLLAGTLGGYVSRQQAAVEAGS